MADDDFRFPSQPVDTAKPVSGTPIRRASGGNKPALDLQGRALQLANEIRAHARTEASQGQLSPTDNAIMLRIEAFLRNDVAQAGR